MKLPSPLSITLPCTPLKHKHYISTEKPSYCVHIPAVKLLYPCPFLCLVLHTNTNFYIYRKTIILHEYTSRENSPHPCILWCKIALLQCFFFLHPNATFTLRAKGSYCTYIIAVKLSSSLSIMVKSSLITMPYSGPPIKPLH